MPILSHHRTIGTYLQMLEINQVFLHQSIGKTLLNKQISFNVHLSKFMRARLFRALTIRIKKDFRIIEDQKIVTPLIKYFLEKNILDFQTTIVGSKIKKNSIIMKHLY